jgi:hypothetical protein
MKQTFRTSCGIHEVTIELEIKPSYSIKVAPNSENEFIGIEFPQHNVCEQYPEGMGMGIMHKPWQTAPVIHYADKMYLCKPEGIVEVRDEKETVKKKNESPQS